jgi:thiamine-phosphate pyrophosphorylase
MTAQRLPALWLLTDERLGESLPAAMERAAKAGAAILVRHYRSSPAERRRIAEAVRSLGAPLGIAGDVALAREAGACLVHNPASDPTELPWSRSVHDEEEAGRAAASAASLLFVSPVYPTRSHPGAPALGAERALDLARRCRRPAVALGGMDAEKGRELIARGFYGWAGIDCWLRT